MTDETYPHDTAPEELLTGGSLSEVVRIGDTVRRPWRRWSQAVHGLLQHLEAEGLSGVPRYLGRDARGREVLSFIEGEVATRPWPPQLRTLAGLHELGRLLRTLHDAARTYVPPADAEWLIGRRPLEPGELVMHGDLGPWNVVYRDGHPAGIIDFDFAEPGPPTMDLGVLALYAVPLRDDDNARVCGFDDAPDRRARLHALVDGYGGADLATVLDHTEAHLQRDGERTARHGPAGLDPWDLLLEIGNVQDAQDRLGWLRAARRALV